MSTTVIAHFCQGEVKDIFPEDLKAIAGEGQLFTAAFQDGGMIVASFDTNDQDVLVTAFEKHLESNELTALALHRKGDTEFCTTKTAPNIF